MARRGESTLVPHLLLSGLCALMALPLLWMVTTALKTRDEVFNHPYWWIPLQPHLWTNIKRVFTSVPFAHYIGNSVYVSVVVTVCDLFFSTLAGYALAKFEVPGRRLFFAMIIATMMIPFIIILIPEYVIIRDLGWLDTYTGLIVPFAISSFGVFLMRQAFTRMPDDLIAAARIDGAGEWHILFRIAVPLRSGRPACA
jgi:multiple sugar transport system permease protein